MFATGSTDRKIKVFDTATGSLFRFQKEKKRKEKKRKEKKRKEKRKKNKKT